MFDNISETLEVQDTLQSNYNLFDELNKSLELYQLDNAIDSLEERYKLILKYSLQGMTQTQIGERIGLSQAHVARLYNKAVNLLRNKLKYLR